MTDRLLVGVLGNLNSGKSHTWNTMFGTPVRTGKKPRCLNLQTGECVKVFLVSGSFEERKKHADDILGKQDCRVVLCSMQYTAAVRAALEYFIGEDFYLYIQWLNPGYSDPGEVWDRLGLVNQILSAPSTFSIRNGQDNADARVQEMREFVYGWAKYRGLLLPC